jgi:hypothetical protein
LELLEGFLLDSNDDPILALKSGSHLTLKSKLVNFAARNCIERSKLTILTASIAYSTWRRFPLGEKIVIAES